MLTVESAVLIIDEELTLLGELRRFAANPNALALMQRLVANGAALPATSRESDNKEDSLPLRAERGAAAKRRSTGEPTGLKAATLKACASFGDEAFTTPDVVERMIAQGYKFRNSKPRVATSSALQGFEKTGRVKLVKRGRGSYPSRYKNIVGNLEQQDSFDEE